MLARFMKRFFFMINENADRYREKLWQKFNFSENNKFPPKSVIKQKLLQITDFSKMSVVGVEYWQICQIEGKMRAK